MIYETKEISSELLSGLKPNNYTRRIKSHVPFAKATMHNKGIDRNSLDLVKILSI